MDYIFKESVVSLSLAVSLAVSWMTQIDQLTWHFNYVVCESLVFMV